MLSPRDYDRFCQADPDFYELPELLPDAGNRFATARRDPPAGWTRSQVGWWVRWTPPGARPPEQGWRIEVSSTPPGAESVAETVWAYGVARSLPFEIVRSAAAAQALNSEEADRLTSGVMAMLHPQDEDQLTGIVSELSVLFEGATGPRILPALRHGTTPVHVRYASTRPHPCPRRADDGLTVLARPDGSPVTDTRGAVFALPDWVELPAALKSDQDALHTTTGGRFPYQVSRALAMRNGGGTYLATERHTGRPVVLREARPHAGLDRYGQDAVTRLDRVGELLTRLAGPACVPALRQLSTWGEHRFLAVDHVEGPSLQETAGACMPLTVARRTGPEAAAYTAWALGAVEEVERALRACLACGVRLTGLDAENVVMRPSGGIALVGIRALADADDSRAAGTGDRDAGVPDGLGPEEAVAHLLARLTLQLFCLAPWSGPAKAPSLVKAVEELFPVPKRFGSGLLPALTARRPEAAPPWPEDPAVAALDRLDWPVVRQSLVDGIHAMATPDRPDRLFPATPTGRAALGGYAFGYGAAGVLYALHRVGASVPPAYVDWLRSAVERTPVPRPGLYDGLHGVALILDLLGHRDAALEVLERCPAPDPDCPDLAEGLAGAALTLLHFARVTGTQAYRTETLRMADVLARTYVPAPPAARPGRPDPRGLLHGPTGAALLFLHLHETEGTEEASGTGFLALAERAISHDIGRCTTLSDGTVVLAGRHNLPYLHGGSLGLATVVRDQLRLRSDPEKAALLTALRRTAAGVHIRNSGLLRGRAGAIATLAALDDPADVPVIRAQIRRLAWHARSHRGRLAFPGYRRNRLSADLATGSAGVLLALDSAFEKRGRHPLPFLDTRPTRSVDGTERR
ncbi:class III lanthionine synthetase LanKC [Streptomyces sp. NPDC005728]|uniref:class III lanthionine synthetase LanKC n=1 Tax=Streptomyces sp. NPDC005728 TaxID=3157054 RepID=UPI00340C2D95